MTDAIRRTIARACCWGAFSYVAWTLPAASYGILPTEPFVSMATALAAAVASWDASCAIALAAGTIVVLSRLNASVTSRTLALPRE